MKTVTFGTVRTCDR